MIVFDRAKKLIDYTLDMTDSTKRYSKKRRFTYVDRMQNMTLDIYRMLSNANKKPVNERRDLQDSAMSEIDLLLFFVERSLKKGFIDKRQCELWTKKALDVKYLTAAWKKSAKTN